MGEILSQSEIDALLKSLTEGGELSEEVVAVEEKEEEAKPYDFRHPDKFSREHMRNIQLMHEDFVRRLVTMLSGKLRTLAEGSITAVDQLTYTEFTHSIPNPTAFFTFSMSPLEGMGALQIPPSLAFAIVERLLGGPGTEFNLDRELSEIEQQLITGIASEILTELSMTWEDTFQVYFKLEGYESNPLFANIVAPNEIVLVLSIELKLGEASNIMTLAYPYITLDPILHLFTTQYSTKATRQPSQEESEELKSQLGEALVPITVILGKTELKLSEVLKAKEGDVIILDKEVGQPVDVYIEDLIFYKGEIGKVKSRWGVRIVEEVDVQSKPRLTEKGVSEDG